MSPEDNETLRRELMTVMLDLTPTWQRLTHEQKIGELARYREVWEEQWQQEQTESRMKRKLAADRRHREKAEIEGQTELPEPQQQEATT